MKSASITILVLILITGIHLVLKPRSPRFPALHVISDLPSKYAQIAEEKATNYLVRNVSLIPMNSDTILYNMNVLVHDGRIEQVTDRYDAVDQSSKPVIIDGTGQYLMPALSDMHVHVNDDNNLLLFLANGVTTVRNMAGAEFHLELRKKIRTGEVLGPELYTASPILEGNDKVWKSSIGLSSKAEARNYVQTFKDAGYDFVKVYHTVPGELYRQIMTTADSIGIPVVGHLPFEVELEEVLTSTLYSIEHSEIRWISPGIPIGRKEEMIVESKKWLCPTLVVLRNIQERTNEVTALNRHYERYVDSDTKAFWRQSIDYGGEPGDYELQKRVTQQIFFQGGRFLTGTDCLNRYVLAGFSLHEELQELVNAGLPEYEVLKASTVNAAAFLGRSEEVGTIEQGKIADMILLRASPLDDISNTRKINGVFVRGLWFSSDELKEMLQEIQESY